MLFNVATPVILTYGFNIIIPAIVDHKGHIAEHLVKTCFRCKSVFVTLDFNPIFCAGCKVINAVSPMVVKLCYSIGIQFSEYFSYGVHLKTSKSVIAIVQMNIIVLAVYFHISFSCLASLSREASLSASAFRVDILRK